MTSVAIIGAGMCGLICAQQLSKNGFKTFVFEKSRGLGGRIATRRLENGVSIDHGVQYVRAIDMGFKQFLNDAISSNLASTWKANGIEKKYVKDIKLVVGVPGMSSLLSNLTENINVNLSSKIKSINFEKNGWILENDNNKIEMIFDIVILALPHRQVIELIPTQTNLIKEISKVEVLPCWTLLLAFNQNFFGLPDYIRLNNGKIFTIVKNSSKPSRKKGIETYVIHMDPQWSLINLELDQDQVASKIFKIFLKTIQKSLPNPIYFKAHRWRFALTSKPLGKEFLSIDEKNLFIGGDWCLGSNVESAYLSGSSISKAIRVNHF